MAGFGFAHGALAGGRLNGAVHASGQALVVSPSADWTGKANSGFVSAPQDPVRTTAKPAMRLIVPPNQFYSDEVIVGVYAGAAFQRSLSDNMGLEKVIVHYEGAQVEIKQPSVCSFQDANGNSVAYYGWWIVLMHDGRDGTANLYFEAVPKDTTMQNRVLGPYLFSPCRLADDAGGWTTHDYDLTIEPSRTAVNGARYPTPREAIEYLKYVNARNPRIRLMETALYSDWEATAIYAGEGWLTVEAPPTITATIGFPEWSGTNRIRPRHDAIRFKGANLVFDMAYCSAVYNENNNARQHWFDGVTFINSHAPEPIWQKRTRDYAFIAAESPYFTECTFDWCADAVRQSQLARGCIITNGYNDQLSNCACAVYNVVHDCSSTWMQRAIDAMIVHYNGEGGTATLAISGNADDTRRTLTAKVDGTVAGTFLVSTGGYFAGTNYTVKNVIDWLNGLPGWTATLLDDRWCALYLSGPGYVNGPVGTPALDMKTAPVTFVTRAYPHSDLYSAGKFSENVIIAENLAWNNYLQLHFKDVPLHDCLIVNNRFQHTSDHFWNLETTTSHLVIAQNSTDYQVQLKTSSGFSLGKYGVIANNVFRAIGMSNADFGDAIRDNHCMSNVHQTQSIGYTSGGDAATLFASVDNGDFAPRGALLENPKRPAIVYDCLNRTRKTSDAAGALSEGYGSAKSGF